MEKKFKVESFSPLGSNGAKTYYTFEEAKIAFRQRILSPEGVPHITDHIDDYVKEHYPENPPVAFSQLKDIITKLLTDPDYPANISDIVLEDFEDDNIEFYFDSINTINCYVNNDDYDGKFPLAEIHMLQIDDPEDEYYFFLTEKRDCFCWSWNITLAPLGNDELPSIDDDELFFETDPDEDLSCLEGIEGLDDFEDYEDIEDIEDFEEDEDEE